jgi:hypothetical protein
MLVRALFAYLLISIAVSPGYAADRRECFSKHTRFNVCERARDLQREIADTLPLQLTAEVLLAT